MSTSEPLLDTTGPSGETKPADSPIEIYRHSSAHLLAAAVTELFPEAQCGIGPPTDDGFFYDFLVARPFTPEDLAAIEKKMAAIVAEDRPIERKLIPKAEALDLFAKKGQTLKCELIREKAGEQVQCYTMGEFVDFCLGPHLPSTSHIKAFKLNPVPTAAYWKGREGNASMQRVYGYSFFTPKELDEYLVRLEEAKKRDHRKLGKELELISIEELAGPGLIFFLPKGGLVRKQLEDWMRDQYLARGYSLVVTPHVMRKKLWETSGHAGFYAQNMFATMELDDAEYQLKPMNCPGHILIYRHKLRSYRELPVRLGELGTVYRYERSGVLHGLLRVRGFTQDDAHIFCTPEQIEAEVIGCLEFAKDVLTTFGFDEYEAELSTWDGGHSGKYDGTPEQWTMAENALRQAVAKVGLNAPVIPDEAAFYGPKIDIKLIDAIGRKWQLCTVQFDFTLPRRFELEYVGEDGARHQPLMVHRALYGSMERFFGILLEHYAGAFPMWLAPVQAVLIPVAEAHKEHAEKIALRMRAAGLRVHVDDRAEKMGYKIREAQLQKVPYMFVVGKVEAADPTGEKVSVRHRHAGDLGSEVPLTAWIDKLARLVSTRATSEGEKPRPGGP
ncbi:MAG: threonine--tRNA ligase [Vicinamibacteria bacterium]|nr:threonine--tRNA ligase [Vicinamibacteria bacterium]